MKRLHDLDAYVTGELDGAAAEALEEALFDAPDDPDLAFLDRVARHGAVLASHGTFDIGVRRAQVDALSAAGHKLQIVDAGPPTATTRIVVVSGDADMVVTKLVLGRTDLDRVDLEVHIIDRDATKVMKDVLVDEGVIWGLCERPLAQLALGAGPTIARVRHRDGERAVIAEWHLDGRPG